MRNQEWERKKKQFRFRIPYKISRPTTEYAQMLLFVHSRNKFDFRFIIARLCATAAVAAENDFCLSVVIQLYLVFLSSLQQRYDIRKEKIGEKI